MEPRGLIEVFTAGCSSCEPTVTYVHELAASGPYDVRVWNTAAGCATDECRTLMCRYGIHELPAIVVDAKLLACCG